jgi:phage baseplate assembly protein W
VPVHTYTNPDTYSGLTEARWGRDLVLVDCEAGGVAASPTGDWPTIAGRPNLHAAHRRRAVTSPGEVLHRPEYGAGLVQRVGQVANTTRLVQAAGALRTNAARDPRIADVRASVTLDDADRVIAELQLRPRGEPDADSFTVVSRST